MSRPIYLTLVLIGASCVYLFVIVWSFRASGKRDFSTPWLLVPLSGAILVGVPLVFGVSPSPASPVLFRILELLAHLCNILLIWVLAGKLTPASRLAGTLLYAWNPLVLIELAVYANTVGVVMCLLLVALWFSMHSIATPLASVPSLSFTRGFFRIVPTFSRGVSEKGTGGGRRKRPLTIPPTPRPYEIAALVLVGLGVRINFMTLLMAPLLLWFMVRHRRGVSSALMGFAWRAVVVLAVLVAAYLPGWQGSATFLVITDALHLFDFANSPLGFIVMPVRGFFGFVAQQEHFPPLMQPSTAADMAVLATSFFLFALLYLREMGKVRERLVGADALFRGWAVVVLGYVVLAATVFSPGYIVWGVWVVALRRFDRLSACVLLLSCSALLYYPLQQFTAAAMGIWLPVCVFGIPLVYLIVQRWIPAGRMERKNVLT